jgi:hypothetical protein
MFKLDRSGIKSPSKFDLAPAGVLFVISGRKAQTEEGAKDKSRLLRAAFVRQGSHMVI